MGKELLLEDLQHLQKKYEDAALFYQKKINANLNPSMEFGLCEKYERYYRAKTQLEQLIGVFIRTRR